MALIEKPSHIAKLAEIILSTEYDSHLNENQVKLDNLYV